MWKGRQALAIAITLAGPWWMGFAEAAPNWTTPVVLPAIAPGLLAQSAYADGAVEFSARVEVAMPVDLDNVSTRLVVSRQAPGAAAVDELVIESTTTALPLGGVIAVAPNGAVVVAFPEGISNDFNPPAPLRWRAVYRNANGTWEEPATLFTDLIPTPNGTSTNALCAIAPDGSAVAGAQRIEPDDARRARGPANRSTARPRDPSRRRLVAGVAAAVGAQSVGRVRAGPRRRRRRQLHGGVGITVFGRRHEQLEPTIGGPCSCGGSSRDRTSGTRPRT
jgi:hypothetical protein